MMRFSSKNCVPQHEAGFTFIEVIIATMVMAIMSGMFINFFGTSARTFTMIDSRQELTQTARIMLDRMGRELRKASTITSASGTDLEFDCDIDDDGTDDTLIYSLTSNNLRRRIQGSGGPQTILDNVSNVQYTLVGTNVVRIELTLAADDGQTQTLRTAFLARRTMP
ncbi:MAG: ComGF family competence protein [Deltaproteobacteria bacterium]|nr:ComGF family competence protein [Deltaproteobacteria bacterium]